MITDPAMAARLLDALRSADEPLSTRDLARRARLTPMGVRIGLRALVASGAVSVEDDGRYRARALCDC